MDSVQTFGLTVALTELIKNSFGLKGVQAQLLGVLVGTVLGIVEKTTTVMPAAYADWVGAVTYGLVVGLTAVGMYAVGDRFAAKVGFKQTISSDNMNVTLETPQE